MPLVIIHHLLNVSVQLANKRGFKQKKLLIDGCCVVTYFAVVAWQRVYMSTRKYGQAAKSENNGMECKLYLQIQ
jgi:hypothetical protein